MNMAAKSWQKSSVGINRTCCADKEDLKELTDSVTDRNRVHEHGSRERAETLCGYKEGLIQTRGI